MSGKRRGITWTIAIHPDCLHWGQAANLVNGPLVIVGSCLPGCEKVQVLSETESEWTVKVKVGPISKTIQARARATDFQPPQRAAFEAESPELRLEGSMDLRAVSPEQTEVTYRSLVKGKGSLEKLLGQIMAGRLDSDAEEFAANVRRRLEGVESAS